MLMITVLLSCGKDKSNETDKIPTKEVVEMIVEHKYNFNDTFKVFYTTDSKKPIDGSAVIEMPVEATDSFQKTTFIFPAGEYPEVIRFDCGNNKDADFIEIKSIKIICRNDVLDYSDWGKTVNWTPSESLKSEKEKPNLFKIVAVNGVKGPLFMSNIIIQEKIEKYFSNK